MLRAISFALLALLLSGCPRATQQKQAPEPCRAFGQQCELEPGKLGSCSYRTGCTTSDCLYCQSQH